MSEDKAHVNFTGGQVISLSEVDVLFEDIPYTFSVLEENADDLVALLTRIFTHVKKLEDQVTGVDR